MKINILSLFDGVSCCQQALNRQGIKYGNYYSSEIDPDSIKVTQHHYPNTIQLGDVKKIRLKTLFLSEVYEYFYKNYLNDDIHSLQSIISKREMLYRINKEQTLSAYFGAQVQIEKSEIPSNTPISINDRIWFWKNSVGNSPGIYDIIRCGERRTEPNKINVGELCKYSFWWNGDGQPESRTQTASFQRYDGKNSFRGNKSKTKEISGSSVFDEGIEGSKSFENNCTISGPNQEEKLFGRDEKIRPEKKGRKEKNDKRDKTSYNVFENKNSLPSINDNKKIINNNRNFNNIHNKIQITLVECEWGVLIFKGGFQSAFSGSPCQSFSMAGKRKGMVTIENVEVTSLKQYLELKAGGFEFVGQSYLFWEFIRVLSEIKPKYFFLENVAMDPKWKDLISNVLGVKPHIINSSKVSAQNRKRYYWTNIPNITIPEDKGITLNQIIPGAIGAAKRGRKLGNDTFHSYPLQLRKDGKSNCITTKQSNTGFYMKDGKYTPLSVREVEILQTIKEGYTDIPGICNTKRYKMIGNAWTVDVVSHLFKGLKTKNHERVKN